MSSTLDMEFAQRQDGSLNEPLRILVAGQSKSENPASSMPCSVNAGDD